MKVNWVVLSIIEDFNSKWQMLLIKLLISSVFFFMRFRLIIKQNRLKRTINLMNKIDLILFNKKLFDTLIVWCNQTKIKIWYSHFKFIVFFMYSKYLLLSLWSTSKMSMTPSFRPWTSGLIQKRNPKN